jgi:uncharacterized protein YkwD
MNVARRSVLALAVVGGLLVTTQTALAGSSAAVSPSSYAARLTQRINAARAQHGVAALQLAAGTSQVALTWTQHQAAAGAISHNPHLQADLEAHGSPNWGTFGENVGVGPASDPDALFAAYMNSPAHRANILDSSYKILGIAVVNSGEQSFNTMDFVDSYGAPVVRAAAVRAPQPAPRPAPVVVAKPAAPHRAPAVRKVAAKPVVQKAAPKRIARPHTLRIRSTSERTPVSVRGTRVTAPGVDVAPASAPLRRSAPLALGAGLLVLLIAGHTVVRRANA